MVGALGSRPPLLTYSFTLFMAGRTLLSQLALARLRSACEQRWLAGMSSRTPASSTKHASSTAPQGPMATRRVDVGGWFHPDKLADADLGDFARATFRSLELLG
jgi:hypothetical protein